MASGKKPASGASRAKAIATRQTTAIVAADDDALAALINSRQAASKLPGCGGEVAREDGVVRVRGRGYSTSEGTIDDAEVYYLKGGKSFDEAVLLGEADKVAWIDPATGLECIMLRDTDYGFLSGYVGVPIGHPLFGWDRQAVPADLGIEVHGGLTYSRICDAGPSPRPRLIIEARRICHVLVGTMPLRHATDHEVAGGQWWFGFACNHAYDIVPADLVHRRRFMAAETGSEYRNDGYVYREVRNLAAQLKAIGDGEPVPAREGPSLPAASLDPARGR